jgi:ADP-heptose:LPS heptosyltransferase
MRILFFIWSILRNDKSPQWKVVSKQRFRLYSYFLLKKLLPSVMRPTRWVTRFSKLVGGSGLERPNLKHLLKDQKIPQDLLELSKRLQKPYICVMPSSRWSGKKWPVQNFLETLKNLPYLPVVLGTSHDVESIQLTDLLKGAGIPFYSGVGRWNFSQTAKILSESAGFFGADTGLAHLSEAVGVPATILFGPTTSDMGFGPWRPESRSIGLNLGCRPCGKDGRYCYRLGQKHFCLKGLTPEKVLQDIKSDKNL